MKRFETCGRIFDSAIRKRLLKFSKMCFALFVDTDKCFCKLQSVYSVRNRFLTMYQWTVVLEPSEDKKCALWSHWCHRYWKNTSVKVFLLTKTWGALSPQIFVWGGSYGLRPSLPPLAPYSAAYDTTFPKLYMTCNSITCSGLFLKFSFLIFNIIKTL